MKKLLLFCVSWMLIVRVASAAEYVIDFSMITDFERLRPLIDLCIDFGSLERNRSLLESVSDLESLREILERIRDARLSGCPKIRTFPGVKPVGYCVTDAPSIVECW
jgi:hypothetical protein